MMNRRIYPYMVAVSFALLFTSCAPPALVEKTANKTVPLSFNDTQDTTNTAQINWQEYFTDPNLIALIDTALHNNQELNITLQEIDIARNEIRARKGEYLPFVNLRAGADIDKPGR